MEEEEAYDEHDEEDDVLLNRFNNFAGEGRAKRERRRGQIIVILQ